MIEFPLKAAFIALPLEGEAKSRFQTLQKELDEFSDFLKFQTPDQPHLTLYFWKELLKIEYDDVIPRIEAIAAKTQPFTIHINRAGTFGKTGDERVLYLNVAFSPQLATLKKLCPWPNPPGEPFFPHITIARISHAQKFSVYKKQIMKTFHNVSFDMRVETIRLYGKINGEKQTPMQDFRLGA